MANPQYSQIVWALKQGNVQWHAKPNALLAWTEPSRRRLLGVVVDRADLAKMQRQPAAVPIAAPPAAFDWRNRNGVNLLSPVKNQGGCGSCVSFASVAAVEAMARIRHDRVLDASEADLHFCSSHGENCDGWWPTDALNSIRSRGVTTEDRFPYSTAFNPAPLCVLQPDRDAFATKVTEHVTLSSVQARKSWISGRGPVVAVLHVYDDFFAYGTGVYQHTTGDEAGYHCVLIVGYDDAEQAWICKNSWGADWGGEGGFFRIGYGQCGIDETSNDQDANGNVNRFSAWGIQEVILPPSALGQFILQTGTGLHETDATFAFLLAPNRDLFAIKKSNTGTGSTEVHVLSAASGYQAFVLQTGTGLHPTDSTFEFALAPNRDLVAIKRSGTGTGSTEVHVLSAASAYQRFSLQTGTALHETDATFEFLMAANRDLVAIKKSGTGTRSTEIHVLSALSNYQGFVLQTGTALHETDATFEFTLAPNRDLFAIKKSKTGTKTTEVHVLSASSNYHQFTKHTGTVLHETDTTWSFELTAARELFGIKRSNAGTQTTEVHVLRLP